MSSSETSNNRGGNTQFTDAAASVTALLPLRRECPCDGSRDRDTAMATSPERMQLRMRSDIEPSAIARFEALDFGPA